MQCNQQSCIERTAMKVLAPALVQYVVWLIQKAQKLNIKRLYFLARDGYPMYLVANKICRNYHIEIECRYLYCSRYAWRIPQYHLEKDKGISQICTGGIDVTIEKIMKRAGLSVQEIEIIAGKLQITSELKRVLSYYEILKYKSELENCKLLLTYIEKHSKVEYETTIRYLEQEGLFEDIPYGIVDSGWTGSLQKTLQALLASRGYQRRLTGFYFGLYDLPKGVDEKEYNAYYFKPKTNIKRKVYFNNCLFETIYSAPEGMTKGYVQTIEGYKPIFEKQENFNQEYIKSHNKCFEIYTKELLKQRNKTKESQSKLEKGVMDELFNLSDSDVTEKLLQKFMTFPTKQEAKVYGDYQFSDDITEENLQKIALDMTETEIKGNYFLNRYFEAKGLRKKQLVESAWIEGSITKWSDQYEKEQRTNFHHKTKYVRNDLKEHQYRRNVILSKYLIYFRKRYIT